MEKLAAKRQMRHVWITKEHQFGYIMQKCNRCGATRGKYTENEPYGSIILNGVKAPYCPGANRDAWPEKYKIEK